MSDPARTRYFTMVAARIAGSIGAVLGVLLIGRAATWPPKVLGIAIVISALYMVATVPRALARRWRSPDQ